MRHSSVVAFHGLPPASFPRRQLTAESGEIVVALVEDEATVKTLRRRRQRLELHPQNPRFEPILPDREVTLLGRVIEVRRTLH